MMMNDDNFAGNPPSSTGGGAADEAPLLHQHQSSSSNNNINDDAMHANEEYLADHTDHLLASLDAGDDSVQDQKMEQVQQEDQNNAPAGNSMHPTATTTTTTEPSSSPHESSSSAATSSTHLTNGFSRQALEPRPLDPMREINEYYSGGGAGQSAAASATTTAPLLPQQQSISQLVQQQQSHQQQQLSSLNSRTPNNWSNGGNHANGAQNGGSHQIFNSAFQKPPPRQQQQQSAQDEVIELLDSDDDEEERNDENDERNFKRSRTESSAAAMASNLERQRHLPWDSTRQSSGRPSNYYPTPASAAAYNQGYQPLAPGPGFPYRQPSSYDGYGNNRQVASAIQGMYGSRPFVDPQQATNRAIEQAKANDEPPCEIGEPVDVELEDGFVPTWQKMYREKEPVAGVRPGNYKLSLIDSGHFTITGLERGWGQLPSDVTHLRGPIKRLSRGHSEKGAQKDMETGKWRIPLGAYNAVYRLLTGNPTNYVEPISEMQLKIASMGKARLERGYPSAKKLVSEGVPKGLAYALAPFQRGGVDFINDKEGRALIADEMGLGKTIQSIAGMSIYHEEWPVLVLTPSSARYHWSAEFENWLGKNSSVNQSDGNESIDFDGDENSEKVAEKVKDDEKGEGGDEELNGDVKMEEKKPMELLDESNIYVVNRSRDDLIPHKGIRVVICSYGLAPALVEQGKLTPGLFKCAIVDESHMLKNSKTKRTKTLMPILRATSRCILLSGTPALARPAELWPQLHILGTESEDDSWMKDEQEFMKKYGRDADALQNAELHTMLTSTVMIRRLKADILKTMPPKFREKATVNVCTPAMRDGFKNLIQILRGGNGVFGKLATQHNLENPNPENDDENDAPFVDPSQAQQEIASQKATKHQTDLNDGSPRSVDELNSQYSQKMTQLKNYLSTSPVDENTKLVLQQQGTQQIEMWYQVNSNRLQAAPTSTNPLLQRLQEAANGTPAEGNRRGTVLSMMYNLTAEAKKPLIVDMVRRWVDDPSKGKLCIFAHHLSMLDEIVDKVGLSNVADSQKKYIRIDGSTTPLERQSQIKTFQTDPNVRIAVLGLTAAGVAVTLTASSTVWFTELFWTPALMIQAEDRCHRIGQNSRVNCLYFVAKGTLDELLWRMIEKKFKDLGEFVEGMEDQKLVVDKEYANVHELHKEMFQNLEDSDSDDDDEKAKDAPDVFGGDLDAALENDINELARGELEELKEQDDEDEEIVGIIDDDGKPRCFTNPSQNEVIIEGDSQDQPIELSDDESEEAVEVQMKKPSSKLAVPARQAGPDGKEGEIPLDDFNMSGNLPGCKVYKIRFTGRGNLGIQLLSVQGRSICLRTAAGQTLPRPGDILVGINTHPLSVNEAEVVHMIKDFKAKHGVVDLLFAEHKPFREYFEAFLAAKRAKDSKEKGSEDKRSKTATKAYADEIIEIDD